MPALFPWSLSHRTSLESLMSRTPGRLPFRQTPVPGRTVADDPISFPRPLASCKRGWFQRQGCGSHEMMGERSSRRFSPLPLAWLPAVGTSVTVTANWQSRAGCPGSGLILSPAHPVPSRTGTCHGHRFHLCPRNGLSGKPLSFMRKWGTRERGNSPLSSWEPATTHQGPLLLP